MLVELSYASFPAGHPRACLACLESMTVAHCQCMRLETAGTSTDVWWTSRTILVGHNRLERSESVGARRVLLTVPNTAIAIIPIQAPVPRSLLLTITGPSQNLLALVAPPQVHGYGTLRPRYGAPRSHLLFSMVSPHASLTGSH
jgi:hypothetical protein